MTALDRNTNDELLLILNRLISNWEHEVVEVVAKF